jgi:PKD repeat protein
VDASTQYNVTTKEIVALEALVIGSKATNYAWVITGPGSFNVMKESFTLVFDKTGVYSISLYVTRFLGVLEAVTRIQAEEAIEGLTIRLQSDKDVYAINETEQFYGLVRNGSNYTLHWTFFHVQSSDRNDYFLSGSTAQTYTFSKPGTYRVTLLAQNDVSNGAVARIFHVQIPLTIVHMIFDGKVVNGRWLNVATGIAITMGTVVVGTDDRYTRWIISDDVDTNATFRACKNGTIGENSTVVFALSKPGLQLLMVCTLNDVMPLPILAYVRLNVQDAIGRGRLMIYPSTTIRRNVQVTVKAILDAGSSILYNWTVNDPGGSILAETTSNNASFQFRFTTEGAYTVGVIGFNKISSRQLETSIYVQSRLCLPPQLAVTLPLQQERVRSRPFRLEVSATPNCTLYKTRYQWTVSHKQTGIDCSVKGSNSTHVDTKGIETKNLIIAIPEQFLPLGTYCFRFEASLGIAVSKQTFVVSIVESDIVAVIKGGDSRLVGALQQLTLDGSNSQDPDEDAKTAQVNDSLSYVWICRSTLSISSNGTCQPITDKKLFVVGHNCFGDGQVTLPEVRIKENTLQAGRTYLFELHVLQGQRTASTQQQVSLLQPAAESEHSCRQ